MRSKKKTLVIFGLLWLLAIGAGMFKMLVYETTPGLSATPPTDWPANSQITRAKNLHTLVMFGHPHCPCTRASVNELALLMARCQGKLSAYVIMVKPEGFEQGWEKTDIWESAASIPGVKVICDSGGVEAHRFQAKTSGQTFLYDSQGRLLFNGGITGSRGHSGDNAGRSNIVSLVTGGVAERTTTFVFGCSLFEQASDNFE